jgi:ABC-2 type transport system ATP-binding protein
VTATALEVVDLVKRYGDRTAVDGLSFSVQPGTICALLGPNGAGKTSTVEICEGFRQADGGTVRVLGQAPADQALRVKVGVMPQSGGGYPSMPAGELLRLMAAYHRNPLAPALLMERLGLLDVQKTAWRRLSGGQQQRLSLAMAVVGRPELVFLDEPTAGLDPQARRATWELLDALRRDGVTVLLTTHLMDEAEQLADHVVVVDHGRKVAEGSVEELTRGDGQVRFRGPVGLAIEVPGAVVTEAPAGNYLVEGTGQSDVPALLAGVTAWCALQGVLVSDLRAGRSLEDVFLHLTGTEVRT